MTIFEIDQRIEELLNMVDLDTGELLIDFNELDNLQMERDRKCENLALAIKDYKAQAKAIGEEIKTLTDRKKSAEKAAERAEEYLKYVLQGNPFKSAKVAVSFKKTPPAVVLEDGFMEWAMAKAENFIKYSEPEADKTAIKEAIKEGQEIPFAHLEQKTTMSVK